MKTNTFVALTLCIFLSSLFFLSCNKSSEPITPSMQVHVSMEIISYLNAPITVDSTLAYIQNFVIWNTALSPDTTKADSLAQWFTQTSYQITDMWFSDVNTRCLNPINTENVVTLKLAKPDTSLRAQGYSSTTTVVNPCYITYRHYIFTRTSNGT